MTFKLREEHRLIEAFSAGGFQDHEETLMERLNVGSKKTNNKLYGGRNRRALI